MRLRRFWHQVKLLLGPPRRPLGSDAVARELPEELQDTDARGRESAYLVACVGRAGVPPDRALPVP